MQRKKKFLCVKTYHTSFASTNDKSSYENKNAEKTLHCGGQRKIFVNQFLTSTNKILLGKSRFGAQSHRVTFHSKSEDSKETALLGRVSSTLTQLCQPGYFPAKCQLPSIQSHPAPLDLLESPLPFPPGPSPPGTAMSGPLSPALLQTVQLCIDHLETMATIFTHQDREFFNSNDNARFCQHIAHCRFSN